jgi:hypothetical protein
MQANIAVQLTLNKTRPTPPATARLMYIINTAQLIDRQNHNKSDVAIEIERLWVVGGGGQVLFKVNRTATILAPF